MGSFLLRRIIRLGAMLIGLSFIIFMMTRLIPGDPAEQMLGQGANPTAVAALRHELGLDRPTSTQYFSWAGIALQGDFGRSARLGLPVSGLVLERYPRTLSFVVFGSVVALIYSLTTGILA